jgi:single-strand DNA-binding protein
MGVNKVILVGNLGKDPELRVTNSQLQVASFSLATGEKRKEGGNWVDHTEWHNIITFDKNAENCSKYLKKGSQVYVEGRIQTRKWQDKEGKDRWTTEIIANTVQFLGGKPKDDRGDSASYSNGASNGGARTVIEGLTSADEIGSASPASFEDDDIPF